MPRSRRSHDIEVQSLGYSIMSASIMSTISGTSFDVDQQSRANCNRLDFFNASMHGRATEVGQLLQCYFRMKRGASEAVFVHGISGSGKTKVVEAIRDSYVESGAYFVCGKFDQGRMNEASSALVSALTDLIDLLLQSNHQIAAADRIRQSLQDHQIKSLSKLVYNLPALIDPSREAQRIEQEATNEDYNKLVSLFPTFANAISTTRHPVVMFLDDFHLADDNTMSIVRSFLDDETSKHVLLICAYRYEDECGVDVAKVLRLRGSQVSKSKLTVRSMRIANLDLRGLASFIAQLTRAELKDALPLAEVVLAKTTGNPYHVVQFLELLVSEELLFQNESGKWGWHLGRIQSETNKTDNVVELVADKFRDLKQPMQIVLIVASYLGFVFEVALLQAVLNAQRATEVSLENVVSTLDAAVREGVLEPSGPLLYKFSHDKIQGVCYDTVNDHQARNRLHHQIGKVAQQMFAQDEARENYCFLAADHLNRIQPDILNPSEKVDVSELNLSAGSLAMKKSAFDSASLYLQSGLLLLDRDEMWTNPYFVTLELYKLLAKASYYIGKLDAVYDALNEICQNANTLSHKRWALYLKVNALTGQGRLVEAVNEGVAAIGLHGEKIQSNSSSNSAPFEFSQPWRDKTNEELLKPPAVKDQSTEELLNLFSITVLSVYLLDDKPSLLKLLSLRFMELAVSYGWVAQSAMAYAAFGLILTQTEKYDDAHRFGRLAVDGLGDMDTKDCISGIMLLTGNFSLHLREPLGRFSHNYSQGFKEGLKNGDLFLALMCEGEHISSGFHSGGMSVREIEQRMATVCSQANDLNQQTMLSLYLPFWQMILNVQGESERTTTLTGKAMSESEMWTEAERTKNLQCRQVIRFSKLILFCIFNEVQEEEKLFKSIESSSRIFKAHYTSFIEKFYEGLILYTLYRKDNNPKYIILAKNITSDLKKHAEAGNVNCAPLVDFLLAEEVALNGSKQEILDAYGKCLSVFRETNILHYRALANERIGLTMLKQDDIVSAKEFLLEALRLYDQWGAQAKVSQLHEIYGEKFSGDNMSTDSG